MAKAKRATVKTEVIKYVEEERIVLELTFEEAQFLLDVTSRIGGNPDKTRRKHADSLGKALSDYVEETDKSDISSLNRSIYFDD